MQGRNSSRPKTPNPNLKPKVIRFFPTPGVFEAVDQFCEWLPLALENNTFTETMHLAYAGVGDQGTIALASALQRNKHIHTVNLTGNNITKIGAGALSRCLPVNRVMLSLTLEGNMLGNEGFISLFKGLGVNKSLEELRLDNNGADDACVPGVLVHLRKNQGLRTISLTCNELSRRSGEELHEAMRAGHADGDPGLFEVYI